MNNFVKINLNDEDFFTFHSNTFTFEDSIKFSTKMVLEYEKKGFLPNEFLELKTSIAHNQKIDWDTALYKYATYLFDLYHSSEMSVN